MASETEITATGCCWQLSFAEAESSRTGVLRGGRRAWLGFPGVVAVALSWGFTLGAVGSQGGADGKGGTWSENARGPGGGGRR